MARRHYLVVTEEHFELAVRNGGRTGDKRGMQPPVMPCKEVHEKTRTPYEVRDDARFCDVVAILENDRVAEEGFEPPTRGL